MTSFPKAALAVLALAAAGLPAPAPAQAQERPATILVLDASGSMWGQIDGVNKITIAREVVAEILADFPADQDLGFVTYGHRERGQCTDIQTVIAPAPGTAPEIVRIVNQLNPRGMTPMTDAVIAAAQALRHTEQAATVILVSDGIETCNPDPCAAARALAQSGIDFTTHVIGFDVKGEAAALMQMQCIAEETGGRFLTADNAQQLSEALQQVVAAPVSGSFTFTAHLGTMAPGSQPVWDWAPAAQALPLLAGALHWQIATEAGSPVAQGEGNPFTADLPFGEYVVTVQAGADAVPAQVQNRFGPDSIRDTHVIFPPAPPEPVALTVRAVMGDKDGPLVESPVSWTFSRAGESQEHDGNPAALALSPGTWTVTGHHIVQERAQSGQLVIAEGQPMTHVMVFDMPLPQVSVSAPEQVVVGAEFTVTWRAEGLNPRDYVTIVPVGAREGAYASHHRIANQSEGRLRAPAEPGLYEVRFQMEGSGRVLASTPIEVVDTAVTVSAPEQVVVGAEFTVTWRAEGLNPRDYVTIVPVGAREGAYASHHRIADQAEGRLRAPAEPGLYEVRFQMEGSGRVLASTPIEVVDTAVTVSAPEQVVVGAEFTVTWRAEGLNPRDYVTIVPVGAKEGAYASHHRIADQAEGRLRAPAEPGLYEVRFQMEGSGRVLASTPIEVIEGAVTVSGPDKVRAGADIPATWTGAIDARDYITLVPAAAKDGVYAAYLRVGGAASGQLTAPAEAGLYEIRYHLEGAGRVMARHPVEVLAADAPLDDGAGLVAPASARPGETITIRWSAADDGSDRRLALARADQAAFSWISAETAAGRDHLDLTLPEAPGTYELRFLDVTNRKVLGRSIIEVQP